MALSFILRNSYLPSTVYVYRCHFDLYDRSLILTPANAINTSTATADKHDNIQFLYEQI